MEYTYSTDRKDWYWSKQVDKVEIRWPSSLVQTLTNLPGDQILEVIEPASEKEK